MERAPQPERRSDMSPYAESGVQFRNQLRLFESKTESQYETPADAIFGFAEFIRSNSQAVLDDIRENKTGRPEKEQYRLEQSATKLHEFNMANATVLHRYAELVGNYSESVDPLIDTFPWLREIAAWADGYMERRSTVK